jgi:protein-S-isoprenylcysteine O-methyltransferase Ste14
MAQREPVKSALDEIQKSAIRLIDIETDRLQTRAAHQARIAGRKAIAAILGTALVLLGVQSAVLAVLFVLHERATQFVVRPGVAWPMAGLATALLVLGFVGLMYGLGTRARNSNE